MKSRWQRHKPCKVFGMTKIRVSLLRFEGRVVQHCCLDLFIHFVTVLSNWTRSNRKAYTFCHQGCLTFLFAVPCALSASLRTGRIFAASAVWKFTWHSSGRHGNRSRDKKDESKMQEAEQHLCRHICLQICCYRGLFAVALLFNQMAWTLSCKHLAHPCPIKSNP